MVAKDQIKMDTVLSSTPTNYNEEKATPTTLKTVKSWCRAASGHVGLLVALIIYTALGGLVFRHLEYPSEVLRLERLEKLLQVERNELILALSNQSRSVHEQLLTRYETVVQEVAKGGLLVPLTQGVNTSVLARWSYLQAVFFASTVLTTIGYGNITPYTIEGRLFCILFALIGIPMTVSVLADLGSLLASTLPSMPEAKGLKHSLASAAAATSILLVYIAAGAFLFLSWEDDWTFFDGFYFCFVTMTTIGFGDLVPSTPQYMLMCTFYILLGLSLTSTIVEVVRQQYSRSWRHLQALAETLGQLASEHNTSDVQADLKKMITVIRVSKGKKSKDWENTVRQLSEELDRKKGKRKVVQIIVYESSV